MGSDAGSRPWLRVGRPGRHALVAAVALFAAAAPAVGVSTGQAPGGFGAQVILDEMTPVSPKAGDNDKLVLKGHLVNAGPGVLHNPSVSLLLRHRRLSTRGELRSVTYGSEVSRESTAVPGTDHPLGRDLPADSAAGWTISTRLRDLQLSENGVYVLTVTAQGERDAPAAPGVHRVGGLSTFLPYLPERKNYTPTGVAWLWPLVGVPDRDGRGVFTRANAELGSGHRLAELAGAPGRSPVTWLVDPDLLDSAAARSAPHERLDGGKPVAEPADPVAANWLNGLRSQLSTRPVAALPYADPDVAALAHGGYDDALRGAMDRSRTTTAAVLGRESDTTVAVPESGSADPATLRAFWRSGVRTVVLSGAEFPALASINYTPTGRAGIDTDAGHLEALIADVGLNDTLAGDLRAPGTLAVAQQRLLAELAMITLERPNSGRLVLLSPPRRWDPAPGGAQRLLAATAAAPWVHLTDLATLSRTPVPPELAQVVPGYPSVTAPGELRPAYLKRLHKGADDLGRLRSVLAKPGELIDNYTAAFLRGASSAWAGDPAAANAWLKSLTASVRADENKIHLVGRNLVTLSSSHGTIPLTVSNELDQAVRLRPVLRSIVSGRLRAQAPELITIAARRKITVQVPAQAAANGITRVEAELLDATGHRFGTSMALRVNVTNYGSVGLIVVIGGGGLLFVAAVIRNVRRLRRARKAQAAGGATSGAEIPAGETVRT
jgi:hypothetical protein